MLKEKLKVQGLLAYMGRANTFENSLSHAKQISAVVKLSRRASMRMRLLEGRAALGHIS